MAWLGPRESEHLASFVSPIFASFFNDSTFQILPGLYVGNLRDSKDVKQLDVHKITHILSIYDDARKMFKVRL